MRTLARTLNRFSDFFFWASLGSLLLIALCVTRPTAECFLAVGVGMLTGLASCLLKRSGR